MRGSSLQKYFSLLALLLFASIPFAASGAYIDDPEFITRFMDMQKAEMEVGDSGSLNFSIENRYAHNMTNITLHGEMYERLDYYDAYPIEGEGMPVLGDGSDFTIEIPLIANDTWHEILVDIATDEDTLQGAYMVRFDLTFDYQNETYNMKSRGYFNDSLWDAATQDKNLAHGMINFTILGVDGIVSDLQFTVYEYFPVWIFALIAGVTVLFGLLALGFHLQDEYGMFPRLEIAYQYGIGKLRSMKRMFQRD